jgi:hypothetical protein
VGVGARNQRSADENGWVTMWVGGRMRMGETEKPRGCYPPRSAEDGPLALALALALALIESSHRVNRDGYGYRDECGAVRRVRCEGDQATNQRVSGSPRATSGRYDTGAKWGKWGTTTER